MDIQGDIPNYKSGSITLKKEGEKDTSLFFNGGKKQEIHVPINIESGGIFVSSSGGCDIYSEINSLMPVQFHGPTTLKSGAVLRIGTAPVSSGS